MSNNEELRKSLYDSLQGKSVFMELMLSNMVMLHRIAHPRSYAFLSHDERGIMQVLAPNHGAFKEHPLMVKTVHIDDLRRHNIDHPPMIVIDSLPELEDYAPATPALKKKPRPYFRHFEKRKRW